jgi:NTE family protein
MEDPGQPLKEVSLCLSGGGARGMFHVGVLAYLQDHDIKVKAISGTSIGALVGCAYASGVPVYTIFNVLRSKAFRKMIVFNWRLRSLYTLHLNDKVVQSLFPVKNLEELSIPTTITYTALDKVESVRKNKGNVLENLLRSMALYPAFEVKTDETGERVCDGGVLDNMPMTPLLEFETPIICVDLHPKGGHKGLFHTLKQVICLGWQGNVLQGMRHSDIYITDPCLHDFGILNFKHTEPLYELGYQSAKRGIESFCYNHKKVKESVCLNRSMP